MGPEEEEEEEVDDSDEEEDRVCVMLLFNSRKVAVDRSAALEVVDCEVRKVDSQSFVGGRCRVESAVWRVLACGCGFGWGSVMGLVGSGGYGCWVGGCDEWVGGSVGLWIYIALR